MILDFKNHPFGLSVVNKTISQLRIYVNKRQFYIFLSLELVFKCSDYVCSCSVGQNTISIQILTAYPFFVGILPQRSESQNAVKMEQERECLMVFKTIKPPKRRYISLLVYYPHLTWQNATLVDVSPYCQHNIFYLSLILSFSPFCNFNNIFS